MNTNATHSSTHNAAWNDFNDAEAQHTGLDLIPKGTIVPVRMVIKPGGHDDYSQGWTGGYATLSNDTGAVFLSCEFVVTSGQYAKRKLWSNLGLYSAKGPTWGQMGRSFIRGLLNSSRNIHPQDTTPQAAAARRINSFADLDGIEFLAKVDVEKDGRGDDRNVVKVAVEPDHKDYASLMGVASQASRGGQGGQGGSGSPAQASPAYAGQAAAPAVRPAAPVSSKPAWAQ